MLSEEEQKLADEKAAEEDAEKQRIAEEAAAKKRKIRKNGSLLRCASDYSQLISLPFLAFAASAPSRGKSRLRPSGIGSQ